MAMRRVKAMSEYIRFWVNRFQPRVSPPAKIIDSWVFVPNSPG